MARGQAAAEPVLRLRGGKGGFGSNLRAAGKHKLTDNFDACRDLQGRRIRQRTAAQQLAEWQEGAQERERERMELKQLKEAAKAEAREQIVEVDVRSVRLEAAATLANVNDAVRYAMRGGGAANPAAEGKPSGSGGGAQAAAAQQRQRRVDPLLLGSDADDSDDDSSDDGSGGSDAEGGGAGGAQAGGAAAEKVAQVAGAAANKT
jgi:hypothetical protein